MSPALHVILLAAFSATAAAQQQADPSSAQRQAMQTLSFLAGKWSGPVSVSLGPGDPLHLAQTETVEYKLDGLVLLIQGKSTGVHGETPFQALATIAYDDATGSYRIRAYNAGHYVDTQLTVTPSGFSWGFDAGPAHVANTMHLTAKGEWQETSDLSFAGNPPHRSVDMLLTRQP
jgi:hypothetical protein